MLMKLLKNASIAGKIARVNIPTKTEVIQKAILLSPSGKMLLLKRSGTDKRRPLQWDLPGGLLENAEALETGVKREIAEEAGIEAQIKGIIYTKTEISEWEEGGVPQKSNTIRVYYVASAPEETVTISHEHCDFSWVSFEEALNLLEYPRHKAVLEHILQNSLEL